MFLERRGLSRHMVPHALMSPSSFALLYVRSDWRTRPEPTPPPLGLDMSLLQKDPRLSIVSKPYFATVRRESRSSVEAGAGRDRAGLSSLHSSLSDLMRGISRFSSPLRPRRSPEPSIFLSPDRVHPLNAPFVRAIQILSRWGSGGKELVAAIEGKRLLERYEH